MSVIIQLRNDSAENWTRYNPILAQGELGIENDTKKFKIGDGENEWTSLPYFKSGNVDSVNGQTGVVVLTVGDIATEIQMQSINSGANTTNIGQITTNKNAIGTLTNLIPHPEIEGKPLTPPRTLWNFTTLRIMMTKSFITLARTRCSDGAMSSRNT